MANGSALVVGGGISGLTAAYDLARAGWNVELHEMAPRFGGWIHSSPVGDRLVDGGADAFLARAPEGVGLVEDLGLSDDLVTPIAPVPAYIASGGGLHQLPPKTMFGVPTDLDVLSQSDLISAEGIERARTDLTTPRTPFDEETDDLSIGSLCRARLGDEITDLLIDPLIGGINASDIDTLSLRASAPLLAQALERHPSLIEGLRDLAPASGPTLASGEKRPVFYGLKGGTATIIDRLVEELSSGSLPGAVTIHQPSLISQISPLITSPALSGNNSPDVIVLATQAPVAARLLAPLSPIAAAELEDIDYSSVTQIMAEVAMSDIDRVLDASGILFPRIGGTLITACTWMSTKWGHYQRPDSVLLRLSTGRWGDERHREYDDAEIVKIALSELSTVVEVSGPPIATRVQRLDHALPQYRPGHLSKVARVREALATDAPQVKVVGATYDGIGIPACIGSGRRAAQQVIDG